MTGTARAISKLGPVRLTLADVASEVGLAPATLVQRYGSKRGLLLAFAEKSAEIAAQPFEEARSERSHPLDALLHALKTMALDVDTPEELSNNLAFLQMDLDDPEFHRHAHTHARVVRREIASLLDEAIEQGDLLPCDTRRLARAIQAAYNGALVTWAIEREGTVGNYLAKIIDTILSPMKRERKSTKATAGKARSRQGKN
jgi:AcrR family transcriptional regulator